MNLGSAAGGSGEMTASISPMPVTPLPPRTSILSLPAIPINSIISMLDQPSALAFALTHPSFTFYTDKTIWRHIDLFLNPSHGRYPLIEPPEEENCSPHYRWHAANELATEKRHMAAIKEKVKEVIRRGAGGKFGLVRSLTVMPRPGATNAMIQLIDFVGPNLQELTILAPPWDQYIRDVYLKPTDSLDYKWLDSGISLPNLTTIRLPPQALQFGDFISLLRREAAPNVTTLDIWFYPKEIGECNWPRSHAPHFPRLTRSTKLRNLRIGFGSFGDASYDSDDEDDLDVSGYSPIFALFEQSPQLQTLSVTSASWQPHSDHHAKVARRIITAVGGFDGLKDLYFQGINLMMYVRAEDTAFRGLRRVVDRRAATIYDMFLGNKISLPDLEVIYLDPDPNAHLPTVAFQAPQSADGKRLPLQHMIPSLSSALYRNPNLHTIGSTRSDPNIASKDDGENGDLDLFTRLDTLEETGGGVIGQIRSFVHGTEELLHARLLMSKVQNRRWVPGGKASQYTARPGDKPQRYKTLSEPAWVEFTEYDGCPVGRKVIQAMLRVEDVTGGGWGKRGMQVGDEAWQLLLNWRESIRAREEEMADKVAE